MTSSSGEPVVTYTNVYSAFNINDGSLVWNDSLEVKGKLSQVLFLDKGLLVLPKDGNRTKINLYDYMDANTGTITFEKPVIVEGMVIGIVPLSSGILYITTESMNILDQASGTLKWSKSINTTPQLTAEFDGKIFAFDNKSRTLKVVNMNNETVKELSTIQLKFEGKEVPRRLEVMDDGIFIHSDQNVAIFNFDGSLLYAEAVRGAYNGASSYDM